MTLLIFLIVLSVLIFVHELGHFLMARRAGLRVEEFGFGFPPRVWGKKRGETVYSINALPIGGFVRLYGEDESVEKDKERSFYHQGKLTRAKIVVAGVVMNFLLAVLAFSAIAWVAGVPKETGTVKVVDVAEDSPAAQAGIGKDDVILSIDEVEVSETPRFVELVNEKKGQEVILEVARSETEVFKTEVVLRESPPEGEGALGVVITSTEVLKPPLWKRPFVSLWEGLSEAIFWATTTVVAVGSAIAQAVRGTPPEGIAGPVGIFQITGLVARQGALALISFTGILSVNLAILNIVPFPALDGGRLLFILVEALFGRRVVPAFERVAHTVGMIVLLLLILLITLQDITRLLTGGFDFLPTPQ